MFVSGKGRLSGKQIAAPPGLFKPPAGVLPQKKLTLFIEEHPFALVAVIVMV